MNPKATGDNQDDTLAATESEIITPADEVVEANDDPSEDVEDMDGPDVDDDRAGGQ